MTSVVFNLHPSERLHEEDLGSDAVTGQLLPDGLVVKFVRLQRSVAGDGGHRRRLTHGLSLLLLLLSVPGPVRSGHLRDGEALCLLLCQLVTLEQLREQLHTLR